MGRMRRDNFELEREGSLGEAAASLYVATAVSGFGTQQAHFLAPAAPIPSSRSLYPGPRSLGAFPGSLPGS